jgi:arylsulfatase A-like enzyme
MRVVFMLFDSLNRTAMSCYSKTHVHTPNFARFASRAVTFDSHFVGSLPCMPARRDLHTGRLNFLHRSWGPLEPFDNSFPEMLRDASIHSHLVTDHMHYFEDGGATYHGRFRTWDFIRGQEYDPWKAMVQPPLERFREKYNAKHYDFAKVDMAKGWKRMQHAINREWMQEEKDFCLPRCFDSAFEFLELNRGADDWFPAARMLRPARAVPRARPLQGSLPHRLERRRARLAALREGDREQGGDRRDPRQLRGADDRVRPLFRPPARLFRQARHVEGHRPDPVDGSRVPAVGA